jgi:hypothetical protein
VSVREIRVETSVPPTCIPSPLSMQLLFAYGRTIPAAEFYKL